MNKQENSTQPSLFSISFYPNRAVELVQLSTPTSIDSHFIADTNEVIISYAPSPFGQLISIWHNNTMLRLDLFNIMTHKQIHAFAKHLWPEQEILFDNTRSEDLVRKFFSECDTSNSGTFSRLSATFSIALYGSDFDLSVWLKTTKIPPGQTMSYQELASLCGCPKGARAIGNALARNRFAYVIPCHRIVRKDGLVGNYRWNQNRKEQLLAWENQNNLYNEQHSHLEN